jgi:signal transduction histidine kinase
MISYRGARQVAFALPVMLMVVFCIALVYVGKNEVEKAKRYAEQEKDFLDLLVSCREAVNGVDVACSEFLRRGRINDARVIEERAEQLRNLLDEFARSGSTRGKILESSTASLGRTGAELFCVSLALRNDLALPPPVGAALVEEDLDAAAHLLAQIREEIQSLLRTELDQVEIWQRQSVFFHKRLQYLVASFALLVTLLSAGASLLLGYVLAGFLRKLREGTLAISSGNFAYRFTDPAQDEIGMLMRDFNAMASRLDAQSRAVRDANRQLQARSEALFAANQHKDRFMANMSHEFRTPLNAIIGFAELLVQRSSEFPSEKTVPYGQRILAAAEHLLSLINDLLTVAKSDAGALKPVWSRFDPASLVQEVVQMLKPMADAKGLSLDADCPTGTELEADRRLILQSILNIVGNAIKFTREGRVHIRVVEQENEYDIEVSDTGIGIGPEDRRHLFRDFYRSESGLTSNYDGTGLGLTLSKRLVELHGGSIIVSSELNRGSTFTIRIPKQQNGRKSS